MPFAIGGLGSDAPMARMTPRSRSSVSHRRLTTRAAA
jgi:hypothetical protein